MDPEQNQNGTPQPDGGANLNQTPDPQTSQPSISTDAPQPGAAGAGHHTPAPSPQPQAFDFRGYLAEQGLDVSNLDDRAAADRLMQHVRSASQVAEYVPYVESIKNNWSEYQRFIQQQQQAAQPQQQEPQEKPWYGDYKEPEYDDSWQYQIQQDELGNLVPKPGAPPDVVQKYRQWQDHLKNNSREFFKNPYKFIENPVRNLVREEAQRLLQEQQQITQEHQIAQGFVRQNQDWLFAKDQNGQIQYQPVIDPRTGSQRSQPVLSEWGQRYQQYVQHAMRSGVASTQAQAEYALGMVQRDALTYQQQLAMQQQQQQQPQQPAQPTNSLMNLGSGPGYHSQSPSGAEGNQPFNLGAELRNAFRQNGITDEHIANGM